MGPYKLDPPRLRVLKLDAVEKFKKSFSEAAAHDSKLRAFPLIEQAVLDHLEIEQQVEPVEIKPPTPGGSLGRTPLDWPADFEKSENNDHLFTFLERHAAPADGTEGEAILRQVKCPSTQLSSLTLTDVTTPIATFQRRQKTLKVPEDTTTSIFIHSFLSTQPQLAQQVEDSKPNTMKEAVKTLVERLKALDQARTLVQSLGMQITARKLRVNNDDDEKTTSDRHPCLGCGGKHHTKRCQKGPWEYTDNYNVQHATVSNIKPKTATVPKALRPAVDPHMNNL